MASKIKQNLAIKLQCFLAGLSLGIESHCFTEPVSNLELSILAVDTPQ